MNYRQQKYFLHDPEGEGMEYFDSEEARDIAAKEAVDLYLDDDGWNPDVTNLVVGVVTASAQQADRVDKPDGVDEDEISWDPDHDYVCNYKLRPITPENN
jgi:hypothetical protein